MKNDDLSSLVSRYIADLSAGTCRLSHETISEVQDPAIQQLLTALLVFYEDLTFERERLAETSEALRNANEQLASYNQGLKNQVEERTRSLEEGTLNLQRSHAEVEKWFHAFEHSKVPMGVIDRQSNEIRSANAACLELLKKREPSGVLKFVVIASPDHDENVASGTTRGELREGTVVTDDQSEIRVLLNRTELPPRPGCSPEDFITLLDIRDQVAREHELEIFRDVAEGMPIGLLLAEHINPEVRGDFVFTWANEAAGEMSTVPRQDLINKSILKDYPDLLETDAPDLYEKALRSSKAQDLPSLRYDGEHQERAIYDVRAVPVGTSGRNLAILYNNVTARQDDLERLESLNAELATSNRNLDHFAAAASHDLREPVRTIQNYCEMLRESLGELDEEPEEFLTFIQDGAFRMQELVQGLLQFSSISRSNAEFGRVDLNEQARIVEGDLALMAAEKNATMQIDTLPLVSGDTAQLRQVLQNLVANAIKYVDNEAPFIHVGAANHNDHVQIFVEDNGKGIPEKHRERAFGMFCRLHDRSVSGSGIGLALCQDIVQRHEGKIWVEESESGGAKLCFTLTPLEGTAA